MYSPASPLYTYLLYSHTDLFLLYFLANPFQSLEIDWASKITEVTSSLKSHDLLRKSDHLFYSLKTLKGYYLTKKEKPLESSFKSWMGWGMTSSGNLLTVGISFHKAERGYTLSDILECHVAEKYYLSDRSVRGMINHARNSTQKTNVLQPSLRHIGKVTEEEDL